MNASEYLLDVRQQLKGLSREEQDDILAEIATHFDSAEEDPRMGATPDERRRKVLGEMGTPSQMGRGLRDVHRPNRFIDLLWLWIPYLLVIPLTRQILYAILGPMPADANGATPHLYLGGRLTLLFIMILIFVSWRRRSAPLTVFWLTEGLAGTLALILREERYIPGQELIPNSVLESFVLFLLLIALAYWLFRALRQNHFDLLIVVFALQPVFLMAANIVMTRVFLPANIPSRPTPFMIPAGIYSYIFYQLGWLLGISIFILFKRRDIRWFGLLWVGLTFTYPQVFMYWSTFSAALLWGAHVALVAFAWGLDWWERRKNQPLVE